MSTHKVIKVRYDKHQDTFTYKCDDPSVFGDPENPFIVFGVHGKMEFRCDSSDGIELRFHKADPANWEPDPPEDEGYHQLREEETCLVIHNNHCHVGKTKLTLKLECHLNGNWKRKDSDPIVINIPPA